MSKAERTPQKKLIDLERKLASELLKQWRETYTKALKEVFKAIPKIVSKDAIKLLQDVLLEELGPAFGSSETIRNLMDKHITRSYSDEKLRWFTKKLKDSEKSSVLSLPDKRAISVLTRNNCFWIGQHYGTHVGPKIADLTQKALNEGKGRDALAEELRQELGDVAPEGYSYWDVVSSSALVRARSFGAISGMEEAGITEYEILAMGDERVCDICEEMDGRVFSVEETRKVIDHALDITDPEAFKAALPWQTEPPVGKSSAQLTEDGQNVPPFHGRCRCTVVMVNEDRELITAESFSNFDFDSIISIDNDTRIAQFLAHGLPNKGLPGWKYDRFDPEKGMQTRRFFDYEGNPIKDVDYTDHGKPKKHPKDGHVHSWVNGVRIKKWHYPKGWEKRMVEESKKQQVKKYVSPYTGEETEIEHITVEQFVYVFNVGGEIEFSYDGHRYFASACCGPAQAWEMDKDGEDTEFKDVDDLLDHFKLHTGETLREAMPKIGLEYAPVWPK